MTTRSPNVDLLRSAAALAVVWLHTSAAAVTFHPGLASANWWIGNVADAMSRWAVPVFVMVSGALLLGRVDPPSGFYRRRAARLLVPLVFWSAFYIALQALTRPGYDADTAIDQLVHGMPYMHLWYLYMILGLYAVTPFLQRIVAASSRAMLIALTAAGFAVASLEATLAAFSGDGQFSTFLPMFLNYIPYFLAGHLLATAPRGRPAVMTGLALLAALAIAGVTAWLYPEQGANAWEITYAPLFPLVIAMALAVFAAGMSVRLAAPRPDAMLARIAPLTFGIYLIHPFWLWVLLKLHIDADTPLPPLAGIPAVTAAVFALSALSTRALAALPGLRRTVM